MKSKKFILVTLLVVGLLLVFFCISHFFPRDSKDKFTTNTNADFTVVSSNTLKNYQLTNDGQLKKLDSVEVALPEIVDSWFSKGELDKRYLLFSSGDLLDSTKDERIVSMDFKTGEIKQNVTSHYAYTGSGYSDEYFYTFQATTTDGGLYQFDKSGKETNSYLFNTSTTPST